MLSMRFREKKLLLFLAMTCVAGQVGAGILSDGFIASYSEAKKLGAEESPLTKFTGANINGVDVVKIEQLFSMVESRTFDPNLTRFPEVAEPGQGKSWIFRIPVKLEKFLGKLDDAQILDWGKRWAATDLVRLSGITEPQTIEALRVLSRLAREAEAAKKPFLLWMAPLTVSAPK